MPAFALSSSPPSYGVSSSRFLLSTDLLIARRLSSKTFYLTIEGRIERRWVEGKEGGREKEKGRMKEGAGINPQSTIPFRDSPGTRDIYARYTSLRRSYVRTIEKTASSLILPATFRLPVASRRIGSGGWKRAKVIDEERRGAWRMRRMKRWRSREALNNHMRYSSRYLVPPRTDPSAIWGPATKETRPVRPIPTLKWEGRLIRERCATF